MFIIKSSYVILWGNNVTWYALMPVFATVCITACACLFARLKKLDVSFYFRITFLFFIVSAIGVLFYQPFVPQFFRPFLFPVMSLVVLAYFGITGRIFHKNLKPMLQFAACSFGIYMGFMKIGCFLAGCCYGPLYRGFGCAVYGEHTLCSEPGTMRFPLQIVAAAFFFLAAIFTFIRICKREEDKSSGNVTILVVFVCWLIYYINMWISNSANAQANRNLELLAILMSAVSLAGVMGCTYLHRRERVK